jgi:tRNA A37 methylthiotransferase MiaB
MRRYGSRAAFLGLVEQIRAASPEAGIRSNVIVGFPGETEDDLAELEAFLVGARMDAVGVFGYSDEDGTAAADLPGKLPDEIIAARVERVTSLVEELSAQRAEDRVGTEMMVLVDLEQPGDDQVTGRGPHQAPDVDGNVRITSGAGPAPTPGDLIRCLITGSEGIDLIARPIELVSAESVPADLLEAVRL